MSEADIGVLITREEYQRQMRENAGREGFQPSVAMVPSAYEAPETSGLRAAFKKGRNTGPGFQFDLRPDFKGK